MEIKTEFEENDLVSCTPSSLTIRLSNSSVGFPHENKHHSLKKKEKYGIFNYHHRPHKGHRYKVCTKNSYREVWLKIFP